MTLPQGPWDIIVADPPWLLMSNSDSRPGRNARRHYPCMRDGEIAALPVPDVAARDALLFLWVTAPMLERAMQIPPQWGFRYATHLIWTKDKRGTGHWARNRHEPVLIYRRGAFPCPSPAPVKSIDAERSISRCTASSASCRKRRTNSRSVRPNTAQSTRRGSSPGR